MDNVTHTLTALLLARAGLNRWTPHAAPALVLAANLPDADVVTRLGGSLTYLDHHRGWTHTWLLLPAMAIVAAALVRLFTRGAFSWRRNVACAALGVASHILYDWTNVYGVRMLAPFDWRMLRLDITYVVDPVILLLLLAALAGPFLSRLVSAEIGARRTRGQGAAILALLAAGAYEGARFVGHERALAVLESRIYDGAPARRIAAFPTPWSPLHWTGYTQTASGVYLHELNLLREFDPAAAAIHYFPDPSPALEAARRDDTFRRFLNFAQFPFWRVTPASDPEGAALVEVMDLRFAPPDTPSFYVRAIVEASGRVRDAAFTFGRPAVPAAPR
jgi:inner membrane protein